MWQLVKSEIEYFKWLYILSVLFVVIINFGLTIDGKWVEAQSDFPGLRVIWLGIGMVVLFFALLFNRKSGRLRVLFSLPLSKYELALSRLIPFLLFWSLLIIILVFFYILNFRELPEKIWLINLVSLSGIILVIDSIPILYSDLYSIYFSKQSKIFIGMFWGILWIIYITLNIIFATYFDFLSPEFFENGRQVLTEIYFSRTATLLNVSAGVFFFFGSLLTFKKRKLYLE